MRLVTQKPMLTAGLKWPPETWPNAETMIAMARPCARAMASRPMPPELCRWRSTQMEPTPKNTRANVPINSDKSFCNVVYIARPPRALRYGGGILTEEGIRSERCEGRGRRWSPDLAEMGRSSAAPLRGKELARGGGYWDVDGRKPVVAVGFAAAGDGEEFFLEPARDRAGCAFADLDVVDGTDGGDFDGGAGEEDFVDDVEHFAGDDAFLDGNLQVFGDSHDRVARDAGQDAGGERRSVERAVVHEKNVHAGAFADVTFGIEGDSFGVTVEAGFHADELRVHVVGGGFGHGGEGVGCDARPGADADVDTFGEGFGTEIGAPGPASHVDVDGRAERIDTDFAVAAQHDGLDVAGVELVEAHQLGSGAAEIVEGVGQLHAINFRGVDDTLHVLAQAEDGGALLGVVAANAFEDRGAVAHDVGEDVECGVIPVDPLSCVPDFFGLVDGHVRSSGALPLQNTGEVGRRQSQESTSGEVGKDKLAR